METALPCRAKHGSSRNCERYSRHVCRANPIGSECALPGYRRELHQTALHHSIRRSRCSCDPLACDLCNSATVAVSARPTAAAAAIKNRCSWADWQCCDLCHHCSCSSPVPGTSRDLQAWAGDVASDSNLCHARVLLAMSLPRSSRTLAIRLQHARSSSPVRSLCSCHQHRMRSAPCGWLFTSIGRFARKRMCLHSGLVMPGQSMLDQSSDGCRHQHWGLSQLLHFACLSVGKF